MYGGFIISFENVSKFILSDVSFCIPDGIIVGVIGRSGSSKTTLLNLVCGLLACEKGNVKTFLQEPVKKRSRKTIYAVEGISFEICEGESVRFIGPNGAGKSTSIKILAGILHPTDGNVEVFGKEPYKCRKENAKRIDVVFGQKSQLWWDLPVIDTYTLLKKIYKIPDEVYCQNLDLYVKCLQINDFLHQPVRQLSLGQRMRAELCAALLHNPELLFLDEPTIEEIVQKYYRE